MRKQVSVFAVRGARYYGARAAFTRGALRVGASINMEREPHNPHDANAVMFTLKGSGDKLGHMARGPAELWTRTLAHGFPYTATVHSVSSPARQGSGGALRIEVRVEVDAVEHKARGGVQIELPRSVSGVYLLKCLSLNRVYVGSALDMRERARGHVGELLADRHHNRSLQIDFNRRGQGDFCFVEHYALVAPAKLGELEAATIRTLFAQGVYLYNRTADGQGNAAAQSVLHGGGPPQAPNWQTPKRGQAPAGAATIAAVADATKQQPEKNHGFVVACVLALLVFFLFVFL